MESSEARRKIILIYIDAGGGHRTAANALCEVIAQQRRPWDMELQNVQQLLDPIDFIRRSTGIPETPVLLLLIWYLRLLMQEDAAAATVVACG